MKSSSYRYVRNAAMCMLIVIFSIYNSVAQAPSPCTQLFISEYGEPDGGNGKYIEIYNPTDAPVDLANYQIWKISNDGTWPESTISFAPMTMLAAYDVYVIANNGTDVPGADLYNSGVINFNGDDAIGIAYNGGAGTMFTLIDAIGEEYVAGAPNDPINGWDVAGVADATANHTLIRKSSVQIPNTDWTSSAGTNTTDSEWEVTAYDQADLGSHTSECANPSITFCVDIGCFSSVTAPSVFGTFNGWNAGADFITDPDGDGIYCKTLVLAPGTYEYKFFFQEEGPEDMVTPEDDACTITTNGFTNRVIEVVAGVPQTVSFGWETCDADCPAPPATTDITLCVDLNCLPAVQAPSVFGAFNGWNAGSHPVTDPDGDGVYCATVAMLPGDQEYKFFDQLQGPEDLTPGDPCTVTNFGFTNRVVTVVDGVPQTETYAWETCDPSCQNGPVTTDITLCVDLSCLPGVQAPSVFGTFNGWNAGANPVTDPDGDGIYCATVSLLAGVQEYKFFDQLQGEENLTLGDPCTVTNYGYTNRFVTVVEGVPQSVNYAWETCDPTCTMNTTPDPAPDPDCDPAEVISLFSNTYMDVTVDTWLTPWSSATLTDIQLAGNDTKLYENVNFLGIETVGPNLIDASAMTTFSFNMWTPNMTTFKVKLVDFGADGVYSPGVDDSEFEITFNNPTQNAWNTYDIPLSDFTGLASTEHIAQLIFSGIPTGAGTFYLDNVYFSSCEAMTAAPEPTCDPGNVISMFSNTYMNVPVDTWLTVWSSATLTDVQILGNDTKLYENVNFLGIETVGPNLIDASAMTTFSFDMWTPNMTTFRVKLVDFGADLNFGGGDDTEFEIVYDNPTLNTWNTYSIPLTDFIGINTDHIAQLIFSGIPVGSGSFYLDNVYFSTCEEMLPAPDPTCDPANVISMFSNSYMDVPVNTWRTFWSAGDLTDVQIAGNDAKLYENLNFVGIETVGPNLIDASAMFNFNIDVWTPNMTTFRVKLVDFGADLNFGGGDDTEFEVVFNNLTQNAWNTLEIPLTDFVGMNTSHIAQLILSGIPAGGGTLYVDNVYFSTCCIQQACIFNYGGPTVVDPCTCAGNGAFDEEVVVYSQTGENWTVYANTGYIDPMTGVDFIAGYPLTENPAGSGVYTLVGQHMDNVGYTLSVQGNTAGVAPTILTISNLCWYPDPSIDNLQTEICIDATPIILTGSAQLGDGSGPANMESESWSIDGIGIMGNTFDPMAAGIGTHTIGYTFDAIDDDPDMHHPGCAETVTGSIEVLALPDVPVVSNIDVCEGGLTMIVPVPPAGGMGGTCVANGDLVISGVFDGDLPGGLPKGVELYVVNDIPDLSIYGLGSANNGGGSDGQEFTFPADPATAGSYIYVASEATAFTGFFGFAPDYTTSAMSINGDDAVELFGSGTVIDVFGDINMSGSGQPWEYMDGWAYKITETGTNGTFLLADWMFSGPNALDGELENGLAANPMPIGSYTCTPPSNPTVYNFYDDAMLTVLLAGGVTQFDPGTTVATSPQSVWVTTIDGFGCESAAVEVVVTVYAPATAQVVNNSAWCGLAPVMPINAMANYPGEWTTNGQGMIDNPSSPATFYTPVPADVGTTVVLTWTTMQPICGNVSASLGILMIPETEDAEFSYDQPAYAPTDGDPILSHTTGVDGQYTYEVDMCGPTLDLDPVTGAINKAASNAGKYSITNTVMGGGNLIITGVIDGDLSGGLPKAIEFYALDDIYDLSIYGVSSANNGGGPTGSPEFTFPADGVSAGTFIWLSAEVVQFTNFFGFAPTYVNGTAPSINGDDAIELFCRGQVIDVFGDVNVDGSFTPWEYMDGWAYRHNLAPFQGEVFRLHYWDFSGPNALDGETSNATAAQPFPLQTYSPSISGVCMNNTFTNQLEIYPDIICPADVHIVLEPGECAEYIKFDLPTLNSDCYWNAANVTLYDENAGQQIDWSKYYEASLFGSPYIFTYTFKIYENGVEVYEASCSFNVTVEGYPQALQTMVCNDEVHISLDQDCRIKMRADMFLEGGPYKCYNQFEMYVDAPQYAGMNINNQFVQLDPGYYTVTVFDVANGNNCSVLMLVEDKIGPKLACSDFEVYCYDLTKLDNKGNPHPDISGTPTITDNCGNWELSYTDKVIEEDCNAAFQTTINRKWVVVDLNNGMKDECVQTIHIKRAGLADVVLPLNWDGLMGNNAMLECSDVFPVDANGNPHPSFTGYPEFGDLCSTIEVFYHDNNHTSNCGPKILRDWQIVDDCTGEIMNWTQIIRITDSTSPVLHAKQGLMELSTNGWSCTADYPVPAPEHFYDNCDTNPQYYIESSAGTVYQDPNTLKWYVFELPIGTHTITYVGVDWCGNQTEDELFVEIHDGIPPVAVCEQFKQTSLTFDLDGTSRIYAEDFDSGSHDAGCGPVYFKVLRNDLGCAEYNGDDNPGGTMDIWYDDYVSYCCADAGNKVMTTLRVFDKDPGAGPVNPVRMELGGDLYGHYNDCWTLVFVQEKVPPQMVCQDVTITCEENWNPDLNPSVPIPFVFSTCGNYDLDWVADLSGLNVCGVGTVKIKWTVSVNGEAKGTCTQKVTVEETYPFDPTTIVFPYITSKECLADPTGGDVEFDTNPCNVVDAEIINIDTFRFVDDACYKILIDWAVIDWCVYEPNTGAEDNVDEYVYFSNNKKARLAAGKFREDGYYKFTEVLMVYDQTPANIVAEDYCLGTATCVTPTETYEIEASSYEDDEDCGGIYSWWYVIHDMATWEVVQYSSNNLNYKGNNYQGGVSGKSSKDVLNGPDAKLTLVPAVGIGQYRVLWTLNDGCSNTTQAYQYFEVADKKPPTPFMVDISTALMTNCMVEVWAVDFDKGACNDNCLASFDNCSETLYFTFTPILPLIGPGWSLDQFGLYYFDPFTGAKSTRTKYLLGEAHSWDPVRNTAGRIYGLDAAGNRPPPNVNVTIYVWDQFALNEECDDGNYDFAIVNLTLNDEGDDCGPNPGALVMAGSLNQVKSDESILDVTVSLDNHENAEFPRHVNANGTYAFSGLVTGEYEVSAVKDGDDLNGVSTLDLVLIQKHLLGIKTFDNVYDLIAADANGTGSISAADLYELRKLILGINNELKGTDSWQFINRDYIFVNPMNPWNELHQAEYINEYLLNNSSSNNFLGIKIGDVNGTAKANINSQIIENRNSEVIRLVVDEQAVEDGQEVKIPFTSEQYKEVFGAQLTMETKGLEFVGVESGAISMNNNNLGHLSNNVLTMSWDHAAGISMEEGDILFTLVFQSKVNANLSDLIRISSAVTPAEIYTGQELQISRIDLAVRGEMEAAFELYQNEPNPFADETVIGFNLPETARYELTIFDVTGKMLKKFAGEGNKGSNTITVNSASLNAGVLYYQLESGEHVATMKMIVIK